MAVLADPFALSSISPTRCKPSRVELAQRAANFGSGMMRHGFILLTFCTTLLGCAVAPAQERRPIAWDGLGQDPNKSANRVHVAKRPTAPPASAASDPNQDRERVLGTLRPYSEAWWAVHDEIEAEKDRQLGTKLVICPRCVQPSSPQGEEVTGSIR
jgi:hypothetical protein